MQLIVSVFGFANVFCDWGKIIYFKNLNFLDSNTTNRYFREIFQDF